MKMTIIKYSSILLIGLLLEWWLIWLSPLTLPENIPMTPIKIDGVILVGLILTILIIAQKKYLKANPDATVLKLTALGSAICFTAELIFQAIRQPFTIANSFSEHLHYFLLGTLAVTIFGATLSFLVSFQLKKKKTGQLVLLIFGFYITFYIFKYFFPTLLGQT